MKINEIIREIEKKGRYHWTRFTDGDTIYQLTKSQGDYWAVKVGEDAKVYKISDLPFSLDDNFKVTEESVVKIKKIYHEKVVAEDVSL